MVLGQGVFISQQTKMVQNLICRLWALVSIGIPKDSLIYLFDQLMVVRCLLSLYILKTWLYQKFQMLKAWLNGNSTKPIIKTYFLHHCLFSASIVSFYTAASGRLGLHHVFLYPTSICHVTCCDSRMFCFSHLLISDFLSFFFCQLLLRHHIFTFKLVLISSKNNLVIWLTLFIYIFFCRIVLKE